MTVGLGLQLENCLCDFNNNDSGHWKILVVSIIMYFHLFNLNLYTTNYCAVHPVTVKYNIVILILSSYNFICDDIF